MMNRNCAWVQDRDGSWLVGTHPVETRVAGSLAEVPGVLAAVERAADNGLYVVGALAYEAASAFDAALATHAPVRGLPLAVFLFFREMERRDALPTLDAAPRLDRWRPSVTRSAYRATIARIRELLAAGDTYQVNYTLTLRSLLHSDPFGLFIAMAERQQARHQAYLHTGTHAICSASPELFVERRGDRMCASPMKGTATRAPDYAGDCMRMEALQACPKNRAENIMIVDMIRNDLGRIAQAGSVRVTELCRVERYPTVLQMVSTVEATSRVSLSAVMRAMFPCASVTGAPKVRTMRIIREIEPEPRGIYTGAVGIVYPGGDFRFNVPIRTAVVEMATGSVSYGVGSGIVWDSDAGDEYDECLAKAAVLAPPPKPFALLETVLWEPQAGWFLLERHLQRLAESAAYFGFVCTGDTIRRALTRASDAFVDDARCVRAILARNGAVEIETRTAPTPPAGSVTVMLADAPVDRNDPMLYHKTTMRDAYVRARESYPAAFDVVLWNTDGNVTESTIANLVVERNGRRITPPVSDGLLAGTFRAELLARGEIVEARVSRSEFLSAERVWLINSVRRWVPVAVASAGQ